MSIVRCTVSGRTLFDNDPDTQRVINDKGVVSFYSRTEKEKYNRPKQESVKEPDKK